MKKWIPCGTAFIEGDVVRWIEPVWKPKARKAAKAVKIGQRLITAQALACGPEWVDLEVLACETSALEGWAIENLKTGDRLRRRREPMARHGVERREYGDESARALVASGFLNPQADREAIHENRPAQPAKVEPPRRAGGGKRGYLRRGRRKTQLKP